jgi:pimeloyl-ACP methyl ester carboxylesterase
VPTLVVWGAADRVVKPEYGQTYAGSIPGARFEVIANAGHYPEIEQPDKFAELVSSFLAQ